MQKMKRIKTFFLFADSRHYEFINDFSKKYPESKIIIILFESIYNQTHYYLDVNNIEGFVETNKGEFDAREFLVFIRKFQSHKRLRLENHLNFPALIKTKKIANKEDKNNALISLEEFVLNICGKGERSNYYSQKTCDVADELLLNAIFNANTRLKKCHTNNDYHLTDEEEIQIKWGYDGEVFGLSVIDPFGSLSRNTVLKYLDGKNKDEHFSMRYASGQRIKMIYKKLHHYIINVEENKMTDTIGLLRFDKKYSDFERRLRSFHYFKIEDDKEK